MNFEGALERFKECYDVRLSLPERNLLEEKDNLDQYINLLNFSIKKYRILNYEILNICKF